MERITSKDIYTSLWRCRDFELSHLWQRSIFLTAFLVMCFTGYGSLLLKICEYVTDDNKYIPFCILSIACLCVAFLGIILSALWIMMGKGSKAWYEKYEIALYNIERNRDYSEETVIDNMDNAELIHGNLPEPHSLDTKLFTTNAGKFSVSRINIAIGQISMFVWGLIYFVHSICFSFSKQLYTMLGNCDSNTSTALMSISFWLLLLVLSVIIIKRTQWCYSSGI
ncbi:RipA family octameric membrane protein [Phocaeicola plebeius]|uniref:RipA family octameric membrane protein n=1 Tax=Phocaeicola plebeius TaxID=310297 RepID=UPI003566ED15